MRILAALITLLLTSSTIAVAQSTESLSAAATRHARELARITTAVPQSGARDDWDRVRRLPGGSVTRVIMRDGAVEDGHVGYVTDERIILLSVSALPPGARQALLDVAKNQPSYVAQRGFRYKALLVEQSGIVFDGTRVADTASVLIEIKRDAIAEIMRLKSGSLAGALLGVAGGGALGVLTALHFAFTPGGQTWMMVSLIGMPIAGGYLGAKAMPHPKWATVYRGR